MKNNLPDNVAPAVEAPSRCPACRSQDVTTTSKVVNAASYWRCGACGEVWNAGRRREAGRYVGYPHLGR
jgi:transposase-like protein